MSINLETEVAVLKSDVNRMASLFSRLDTAIEKMGDVSNNIAKMLAVHEERLSKQDDIDEELFSLITEETKAISTQQNELEKRVNELERWKWLVMGGSIVVGAIAHEIFGMLSK